MTDRDIRRDAPRKMTKSVPRSIQTPEASVRAPDIELTPALLTFLSEMVRSAQINACTPDLEEHVAEMEENCVWMARGNFSLATVSVKILQTIIEAIVDCGATRSIMSRKMADKLRERFPDLQLRQPQGARQFIKTASGESIEIDGILDVDFELGGSKRAQSRSFLVLNGLPHDLLLGLDFLYQEGVLLDFRRKLLILEESSIRVPMKFETPEEDSKRTGSPLYLAVERTLPPMSTQIVDMCMSPKFQDCTNRQGAEAWLPCRMGSFRLCWIIGPRSR